MLCIDLFCGLGGWSEGFVAEGWDVLGFDLERHQYGEHRYPAQLVLQDVLTLHGSQFKDANMIVGSPPCQAYSYMAQPWRRAKREIAWQQWARSGSPFAERFALNDLFDACFRIQRQASEAAGRHVPMVVENVRGAQRWVGRAAWHFGSFYLWGEVPAIMPHTLKIKNDGGSWFNQAHNTGSGTGRNPVNGDTPEAVKQRGSGPEWFDKALDDRRKESGKGFVTGLGKGHDSRQDPSARFNSKSDSRKAASALIAKIPFELSSYIARYYKS